MDMVLDTTALADEGARFLEALHWLLLGTGDKAAINGCNRAHACFVGIRDIARAGAALIESSTAIEPYSAVRVAGVEAAA